MKSALLRFVVPVAAGALLGAGQGAEDHGQHVGKQGFHGRTGQGLAALSAGPPNG